jgi:hypothetical protein
MTLEQGREQIAKVVDGYRHKDYHEVKEVTKYSHIIHAEEGDDLGEEITRYRKAEKGTDAMRQRLKAFNPITRALLNPTYSTLQHIPRADGQRIQVEQPDDQVMELVDANFERFYGEETLVDWVTQNVIELNKIDPNAWIGFERLNVDQAGRTVVQVYPVEFSGVQAVDFGMTLNGKVSYLAARIDYKEKDASGNDVDVEAYWLYLAGFVIRAIRDDKGAIHTQLDPAEFEQVTFAVDGDPVRFLYSETENGSQEVPFFNAGAFPYERTTAKELLIQPALGVVLDVIRDKMLLDVLKMLHITMERAEYRKECTATNEQNQPCIGGYFGGIHTSENFCKTCNGKGHTSARNEQDVLELQWGENMTADQMIDLSKLVHYFDRPLDIPKFYVEELSRQANLIFTTTYNQNGLIPSVARTATEVMIQADMINNKLSQIAARIEAGIELAYRVAFQYYGRSANSDVSYSIPREFGVLSLSDLTALYKQAKDAGVPVTVTRAIEYDMIEKAYPDWPDLRAELIALTEYKPYRDKSEQERALIIAGQPETAYRRVLWENWSEIERRIKAQLRASDIYFHQLTPERQQQMLDVEVAAIVATIQPGEFGA